MKTRFKILNVMILCIWMQASLATFSVLPCIGEAPLTLNLNAGDSHDADGRIVSYQWFVSTGQTASGPHASVTFKQPGNYAITLTVTDEQGSQSAHTQNVAICGDTDSASTQPTAAIATIPNTGPAPLTVILDGTTSTAIEGRNIVNYQWFTSDGQKAFGHTATLIFPEEGQYSVTLVVTDSDGQTALTADTIRVTAPETKAPVANLSVTPNSGPVPLTVSLDASEATDPDGRIIDYAWTVREESSEETLFEATEQKTSFTFDSEGTYLVSLTVTDNDGLKTSETDTVTLIEGIEEGELAELSFMGLKAFYAIGEKIVVDLQEHLNTASREKVDLWVAMQLPWGDWVFKTALGVEPFSPTPQPFRSGLEASEAIHRILDFEVVPGVGGEYAIYALYVEEGKNPLTDGLSVRRSETAIAKTHLAN
ncbi:MAG: PKD domain-containing protein [Candidatus Parabeggiatoa sp.]|nr:PKD domain-containing protein [Candidatus Parabeggiatoa sp.]